MSSEGAGEIGSIGPGSLILVVGPSGSGKDALLRGAQQALAVDSRFVFPKRIISREADTSESHIPVTDDEYSRMLNNNQFALHWQAHGLSYGIPVAINSLIQSDRAVVVNASRTIIAEARTRYLRPGLIAVDCRSALRAERIAKRGREGAVELRARLSRSPQGFNQATADVLIDNSGDLDSAIAEMVAGLVQIARSTPPGR